MNMLDIAKQLIQEQFPAYAHLKVRPVAKSGHDNDTFHLGDDMSIRLPSGEAYVAQVEKEGIWLPYLQAHLAMPISSPIALGIASSIFPYPFSINRWIEGDTLTQDNVNKQIFAQELACFLKDIQKIDASKGPRAGLHNFYRGGDLCVYHDECIQALSYLTDDCEREKLRAIWTLALRCKWEKEAVWVHGDIAPGNLLVKNQHLCAIIDFGILGTGDPACDYAMAWTYFDSLSRPIFLQGIDLETRNRAVGWALWKALISIDDQKQLLPEARSTIDNILLDESYANVVSYILQK